jgi:hypothetical protein
MSGIAGAVGKSVAVHTLVHLACFDFSECALLIATQQVVHSTLRGAVGEVPDLVLCHEEQDVEQWAKAP